MTDSETGIKTTYYYDFTDRMMKYVESGSGFSHSVGYEYDTLNNLTALVETINGVEHTTSYAYDKDNRITSVTNGSAVKSYTYDTFGRSSTQTTKNGSTTVKTDTFTFKNPTSATTSAQIATHKVTSTGLTKTFSYTYDKNGNILTISDGTNTTSYVYDSANQLVRENNQAGGFTHTWTYDNAGNIQERKEYAYTTGTLGAVLDTITYAYEDTNGWGDLLTAYDGQTITYDTIGNPLTDGTWTYTWQHGRQLASMTDGSTTWNYTYNADGLRTKKTNGTTTYEYIYNGSQLSQMTVGSNSLYFAYDASGVPMSVTYNDTTYYYVTNVQGDVIGILNASGALVVSYTYDAWGNPSEPSGSLASTLGAHNPLRYRSYIFDQDTKLYYLQSRYYNPETGRFLNADGLVGTGQGLIGFNMFAYCGNNPVMGYDPTGEINWKGFWAGVAIAAVGVAIIVATILTAGAVALAATAIATAVGVAVTATGVITAYGAGTEEPIVFDASVTDGSTHDKSGYSAVVDFDSDSVGIDVYYHYGKTSSSYAASYGTGIVENYTGPGKYGGYFADINGTYTFKGFDYGVDVCTDPNAPFSGCWAALFTVGASFPSNQYGKIDANYGVDYYVPLMYIEWE